MDSEAAPNEVPTEYSLVFYECYINTWFIGSSTLCAPLSFMPFRSARNKSQMASANCQENRKQLILLRLCPIESIPYQSMSSSTSCLVFVSRTDLGRVSQLFFVPFPFKNPTTSPFLPWLLVQCDTQIKGHAKTPRNTGMTCVWFF